MKRLTLKRWRPADGCIGDVDDRVSGRDGLGLTAPITPSVFVNASAPMYGCGYSATRHTKPPATGRPVSYDATRYRGRNVAERCIGWLTVWV